MVYCCSLITIKLIPPPFSLEEGKKSSSWASGPLCAVLFPFEKLSERSRSLSFLYNTRESVSKKPFSPQLSCNSVTFTHYVRPGELRGRSGRFSARSCTVFILFIFSFHAEPKVVSSPREGNNEAHSVTDDRARYLLKKKKKEEREKKNHTGNIGHVCLYWKTAVWVHSSREFFVPFSEVVWAIETWTWWRQFISNVWL